MRMGIRLRKAAAVVGATLFITTFVTTFAGTAQAQPYVAGSLSADIARTGTSDGIAWPGSGEALSFSLRVGAPVAPRFGVELDFTRPSEIVTDQEPDIRILEFTRLAIDGLTVPSAPIIGYQVHTEQRTTSLTAALWARQEVSPRFSLIYLGGIAFAKIDRTVTTKFNYPFALPAIYPPSYETASVDYAQGPMAGIEARIGLTDHVHLLPGLRLQAAGGGWIMRPAVGLGWTF
jgi:hypothetical protein